MHDASRNDADRRYIPRALGHLFVREQRVIASLPDDDIRLCMIRDSESNLRPHK